MPLSSKRFFRNKHDTGGGTQFQLEINIVEEFSGNSNVKYPANAVVQDLDDATTITYTLDSNAPNALLRYEIEDLGNNLVAADFSDSTLAANVTTDGNGNATVIKTVTSTTGTGHKNFRLKVVRPTDTTLDLALGSNVNLYEVIPFDISGGDSTYTSNISGNNYTNDGVVYAAMRSHTFTTTGNSNLTITNYGNFEGNANLWKNVFATDSWQSYNRTKIQGTYPADILIKTITIAGGGAGIEGGGGGGDIVNATYNPANVLPGTYIMHVGTGRDGALPSAGGSNVFPLITNPITWILDDKNYSEIFAGNSNLSITAWSGGNGGSPASSGAGFFGASGGGGSNTGYLSRPGATAVVTYSGPDGPQPGFSDMIDWTAWSNTSPETLTIKSEPNFDFNILNGLDSMGGSGGGGTGQTTSHGLGGGGATGQSSTSAPTNSNGGPGAKLYLNQDTNAWNPALSIEVRPLADTWFNQPMFELGNSNITVSSGGAGALGSNVDGYGNYGSGGSGVTGGSTTDVGEDGMIAISYPYRSTRIITNKDLS